MCSSLKQYNGSLAYDISLCLQPGLLLPLGGGVKWWVCPPASRSVSSALKLHMIAWCRSVSYKAVFRFTRSCSLVLGLVRSMVTRQDPKFVAALLLPSEARQLFRRNGYYGPTSGFCAGYLQANAVMLPGELADDFGELCRRNHGPLPLLYRSKPAEVGAPPLAKDSDIRLGGDAVMDGGVLDDALITLFSLVRV